MDGQGLAKQELERVLNAYYTDLYAVRDADGVIKSQISDFVRDAKIEPDGMLIHAPPGRWQTCHGPLRSLYFHSPVMCSPAVVILDGMEYSAVEARWNDLGSALLLAPGTPAQLEMLQILGRIAPEVPTDTASKRMVLDYFVRGDFSEGARSKLCSDVKNGEVFRDVTTGCCVC
jgi:hypothetical protein